ncbi:VCBS repeat-containing protein [Streptomyces sp. NBC_01336]|uniref:VCBS repeat-containing protein n=1 Tax=Streptomyces sp. NBC_01336 TaxID=2903829 RepID=UPI002E0E4D3D|nr:VCBS repeat-containing protein [Streptomyces sp. NBC_01336]
MSYSNSSRKVLAGTVALAIAAMAGPLALPAVADSGTGVTRPDTGAQATSTAALSPGSEVVMSGATGFLVSTRDYDLLWIRYDDGSITNLGRGYSQVPKNQSFGAVSDVVALEQGYLGEADHRAELHDMSTGAVTVVALGKYLDFVGAVGSTAMACPYAPPQGTDCRELHLLTVVDGVQSDRTVTGLPDDTRTVGIASTAPGSLVLYYNRLTGADTDFYYAVVDLASGVATSSHLARSTWADVALSPKYLATLQGPAWPATSQLRVENRGNGKVSQIDTHRHVSRPLVGLVGDWALFGSSTPLSAGSTDEDFSFRAVPVGGGTSRKILDHATSLATTPDGALLVMGGTLAQGEGVYRVYPGADGAPVVEMVAGTGEPEGITLVSSDVPAVATLDTAPWKARWQLSRYNAEVILTLRNTATGASNTWDLYPSDNTTEPVGMDYRGRIRIDWQGWLDTGSAPNGNYTWQITAKPFNALGPDLKVSGTFKVTRRPAPHDYTDNGSPDLLARDSAGVLWRVDTYQYPGRYPNLESTDRVKVGGGWDAYNRITAVGNVAGGPGGDLVARDSAGVLWLYLGTGKGTFATRTRIGAGWNAYTQLTGTGDFSGDGKADLVARDRDGFLWLYKGTGNWKAPYAARTRIGGGWNAYNQITAVGNVAGGSAGDLVARDSAGVLWLYQGTGKGTFATRTRIGGGWNTYTQLIGMGDSNIDGKPDLLAIERDGGTWRYRGTGNANAPFAAREMGNLFSVDQHYNTIV